MSSDCDCGRPWDTLVSVGGGHLNFSNADCVYMLKSLSVWQNFEQTLTQHDIMLANIFHSWRKSKRNIFIKIKIWQNQHLFQPCLHKVKEFSYFNLSKAGWWVDEQAAVLIDHNGTGNNGTFSILGFGGLSLVWD